MATCQELCDDKAAAQAAADAAAGARDVHQAYAQAYETVRMGQQMLADAKAMDISSFPGGCTC